MDQPEPLEMRVSDVERNKVAELLRDAAADGRLDFTELDERLDATWAAKTYGDLIPITVDLTPTTPTPAPEVSPRGQRGVSGQSVPSASNAHVIPYASSTAVFGESNRRGVWRVPDKHAAFAMFGSIKLDLREAIFTRQETVIEANAIFGSIEIVVNDRTELVVDGTGILGSFDQKSDRVPTQFNDGSPVVRIRGLALFGAVEVVRKRMPGDEPVRRWLPGAR